MSTSANCRLALLLLFCDTIQLLLPATTPTLVLLLLQPSGFLTRHVCKSLLLPYPNYLIERGISTLGHVPKLNRPKALALRGIRFQFPDRLRRYTGRRGYSSNSSSSGQQQKQQNRAKSLSSFLGSSSSYYRCHLVCYS